ncbi:MAG: energy transducer TonB [Gammaproteobacteria bacterium]|nr:energy transducer TonB [Gammaproteobacteria bacterium]
MTIQRGYWLPAFGVAALLHLGVAAAMFWQWSDPGSVDAGMGGLEVALGPAGGSAGAPMEEATAAASVEPPPAPVPEEVRAVEEPPPEVVAAVPVETVEPEPVEELVPELKPEPEPEPVVITEPEPVKPEPEVEPPPELVAVAEPVTEPLQEVSDVPPEPADSHAGPGQVATADSKGQGTRDARDTGSGDDSSGGGMAGAEADYAAILQAWLERHKEYPRRAQRRRQEGTALLYFVMDREGHVLNYRIEESSGFGLLDREVERMIERAQPLPRMPEDMQQAQLELKVPVQFFLR